MKPIRITALILGLSAVLGFGPVSAAQQFCAQRVPGDIQCFATLDAAEAHLRTELGQGPRAGRHLLRLVREEVDASGVLRSYAVPPKKVRFVREEYEASWSACRSALARPCSSEEELAAVVAAASPRPGGGTCLGDFRGDYFPVPGNWWYTISSALSANYPHYDFDGVMGLRSRDNRGSAPNRRYIHRDPPGCQHVSYERVDIYRCPAFHRGSGNGLGWSPFYGPTTWPKVCVNIHTGFIRVRDIP